MSARRVRVSSAGSKAPDGAGLPAAARGLEAPDLPEVPGDVADFSARVLERPLHPYQQEVAAAIQRSVDGGQGHTFTVMMARQMGKNELSAHLEAWLLARHVAAGGTIVKAAPTFRPQVVQSMLRLEACLRRPGLAPLLAAAGKWRREQGYMIALGEARISFYSAEPAANVVGATASLLLEIDEAQEVDPDKFTRDFRPMAAAWNATTVLYGTAWRSDTLLEEQKRRNLELEARDGFRRHFEYDWLAGAAVNEAYGRFVSGEVARLGRDHPLIRTQYFLEPLDGSGAFFSPEQRLLLRGTHPREREPAPEARYIAAVDVAGAAEVAPDAALRGASPRQDSTVVGIARVSPLDDGGPPRVELVEIYWWTGRPLHEQCDRLIHLLRDVWRCDRIAVDATGLGADLAARLERACGRGMVEPFVFSAQSKSRLAFHLLSHVGAGRLQMWAERGDGEPEDAAGGVAVSSDASADGGPDGMARGASAEAAEFWKEVAWARPVVRSAGLLGFAVAERQGHDDFVTMLALLSWAAREARPAPAHLVLPPAPWYAGQRRY